MICPLSRSRTTVVERLLAITRYGFVSLQKGWMDYA